MSNDMERHLHAVHEDWRAVAAALNARMSKRRVSQRELALAAGISVATLRVLQRGDGDRRVQNSTLAAVSRALGWQDGHLVAVLLGDQVEEPADAPRGPGGADGWHRPASLVDGPLDIPTQILLALRRIERTVDDIADHVARA